MYLDVLLNNNLNKAAENCWKVLDSPPPSTSPLPPGEGQGVRAFDDAAVVRAELDAVLRSRCLVTLMDLAARKTATPELVRRLLTYIDQNIARDLAEKSENQQWKLVKFELLIALDKPKDLEKTLDDWIKAGDPDNRWRMALGNLLAEEGKLAEAIRLFEAIAKANELGPAEWRTLADWYQATGRREDYERAKVEIYKTAEEWRLNQWLYGQVQPWLYNQGQLPSQLDPEVVLAFRRCCPNRPIRRTASTPSSASCTRRAAISVSCRASPTASPATPPDRFIPTCNRPKASSTKFTRRPRSIRWSSGSPSCKRRRRQTFGSPRFDLLEAMTERRAAELRNQPGPHVDKAVAALQRAFKRCLVARRRAT